MCMAACCAAQRAICTVNAPSLFHCLSGQFLGEIMTNNDTTLQLSSVLNRECTRSRVHCQSKKRALEIISELAAKQLSLPPQVVFEAILTREKMGSTGIGNGIAFRMANWKKILCAPLAFSFSSKRL